MANQEHLEILKQGVEVWNKWRQKDAHLDIDERAGVYLERELRIADLKYADLAGTDLVGANLGAADLRAANLSEADLARADLRVAILSTANLSRARLTQASFSGADLRGAVLHCANLHGTFLYEADLTGADLREADLDATNLDSANLRGANFTEARLRNTIFAHVDLSEVKGLETVFYLGHSTIGIDTIYASHGNIPEVFLKGVGVDDTFIEYIHSLVGKPIQYYSCFISYSSRDDAFAKRLHADLQSQNVRCWFAPHDMRPGTVILRGIDDAIRMHDKLLLILSEDSVASKWVEHEVEAALYKEMGKESDVLFPIRIDNAVLESSAGWAVRLHHRHIGDFTQWKNHDGYQKAFERLLRDLKASS